MYVLYNQIWALTVKELKNIKIWKCRHCKKRLDREKDNYALLSFYDHKKNELFYVVERKCLIQFKYNHSNYKLYGFSDEE